MLKVVHEEDESNDGGDAAGGSLLDEIVRDGARQMLAAALQAEVAAYVEAFADQVDEHGRRLVVRNGHHQPREVTTAAGAVPVRRRGSTTSASTRPPVNGSGSPRRSCRRGRASPRESLRCCRCCTCMACPAATSGRRWSSSWAPATACRQRRSPGSPRSGRTRRGCSTIGRSTGTDYVYVWVDGIHLKVRLEQDKVCLLVMIGVRADGSKELIALDDGHRESTESWADLLRSCKRRGMTAPVLAVGDGALGFWAALREVFPDTARAAVLVPQDRQRPGCAPKVGPAGREGRARRDLERRGHASTRSRPPSAFAADYGAKWPKAAAKITEDLDVLLAFYDYPAEHWIHLRTTNPIESTFATVRLRQRVTKGPGSRAAGVAMAFKLIESAQARWRAVNAPHLVALVRAGARFEKGVLVERPDESGGDQQVA